MDMEFMCEARLVLPKEYFEEGYEFDVTRIQDGKIIRVGVSDRVLVESIDAMGLFHGDMLLIGGTEDSPPPPARTVKSVPPRGDSGMLRFHCTRCRKMG